MKTIYEKIASMDIREMAKFFAYHTNGDLMLMLDKKNQEYVILKYIEWLESEAVK